MLQSLKRSPSKCENLSSVAQNVHKSGCCGVGVKSWCCCKEVEEGSTWARKPGVWNSEQQSLPQTECKVKADVQGCLLTFTGVLWPVYTILLGIRGDGGETAQLLKCLLSEHEDLCSTPRACIRGLCVAAQACDPRGDRRNTEVCCSASLSLIQVPVRDLTSKTKAHLCALSLSDTYTQTQG